MNSSNMGRFSGVPKITIPRARFDRSHDVKTTFDPDYLIPVLVDPIYPGDTVKLEMSFLARFATLLYPVLDNAYLESFFFFVPNRLIWTNWHKFLGEQDDPGDSIDFSIPVHTLDSDMSAFHGKLPDYLGIPLIDYNTSNYTCSALPARAYHRIWNEWFRDENLQVSQTHGEFGNMGNGPDNDTTTTGGGMELMKRGKRKDYFTGCLPWLQKSDDAVELPLGTSADVVTDGGSGTRPTIYSSDDSAYHRLDKDVGDAFVDLSATTESPGDFLYADLSTATAATVNELRLAIQTQRFLEKDARAGTRMHEIIYSHYGVVPPHIAWRPEYLGGGSTPINVTPVAQTDTNVGDLAGVGTAFSSGHGFTKSFTEHGWLIGLVNVRIDQSYSEGFERWWFDSTRYDIFWPSLQFVGEQAVLDREIYIDDATITAGTDDDVFGYQERYAHLKYKPNRITGLFRSNAGASLDTWHFQEEFAGAPDLNAAFIVSNAEEGIDRACGAPSQPLIIFNAHMNYIHTRAMAVYSVPGMMDHF